MLTKRFPTLKKWDIIIMVVLLTLSFLPELIFSTILEKNYVKTYAEITVNGTLYKTIPLSEHRGDDQFTIRTDDGHYNTVEVKDNAIAMTDADCPDKICIQTGFISQPGQPIVCLPHKIIIEIKGSGGVNDADIIPAH